MSGQPALLLASDPNERKVLLRSALAAFIIEGLVLTAAGVNTHWLAHPPPAVDNMANFIEAQVFEMPPQEHLTEVKAQQAKPEVAISKEVNKGRKPKPDDAKIQEQNQTDSGPRLAPTHGPLAIYTLAPHIPQYLQDKELHVSVVIDFFVSSLGVTSPRLVGSSGNEELDAIALNAAKRWQFRPAEKDRHPTDAKVRLRINFEVN